MATPLHLGRSNSVTDFLVKHTLQELQPRTLVDFGAGAGKHGELARSVLGDACRLVAVEGYGPAVEHLRRSGVYQDVHHTLLQQWLQTAVQQGQRYDMATFGDVLEHLSPSEGHRAIRMALTVFRHVIVIVPLHDIFQDSIEGNDLEIHRAYMTAEWFDRYQPEWKHLTHEDHYTVMAVHLTAKSPAPLAQRVAQRVFHTGMLVLQPLGVARPTVNLLKRVGRRYKHLVRPSRAE